MPSEPTTGNSRRRQGAPPTGYSRIASRSVSMMNATTTKPVNAPITRDKIRKTCPSRCRSSATRGKSRVLHQLPPVVRTSSFISRKCPPKSISHCDGGQPSVTFLTHDSVCTLGISPKVAESLRQPARVSYLVSSFSTKGRHRLYVFSYECCTECDCSRSAGACRRSSCRCADNDSRSVGGDAQNFAED